MCYVFLFGSIFALFYYPNSLQWTDIHRSQDFICHSIIVTFYVPTIGAVCGKLHFKLRAHIILISASSSFLHGLHDPSSVWCWPWIFSASPSLISAFLWPFLGSLWSPRLPWRHEQLLFWRANWSEYWEIKRLAGIEGRKKFEKMARVVAWVWDAETREFMRKWVFGPHGSLKKKIVTGKCNLQEKVAEQVSF